MRWSRIWSGEKEIRNHACYSRKGENLEFPEKIFSGFFYFKKIFLS